MRFKFILAFILVLLISNIVSAQDTPCSQPSVSGCSNGTQSSQLKWNFYNTCMGGTSGTYNCGDVFASNGYAMMTEYVVSYGSPPIFFYWNSADKNWKQISGPQDCGSTIFGTSLTSYRYIGMDKTGSSSYPFAMMYVKWNSAYSAWDYAAILVKGTSSCSGCGCYQPGSSTTSYMNTGANGMRFKSDTVFSFACLHQGNSAYGRPTTNSGVQCWVGGMRPASDCPSGATNGCFDGWGVFEGYGFQLTANNRDPEKGSYPSVKHYPTGYGYINRVIAVKNNILYATSGPSNGGTADGKIWKAVSITASGLTDWQDAVTGSGCDLCIGNVCTSTCRLSGCSFFGLFCSDSSTTPPRFMKIYDGASTPVLAYGDPISGGSTTSPAYFKKNSAQVYAGWKWDSTAGKFSNVDSEYLDGTVSATPYAVGGRGSFAYIVSGNKIKYGSASNVGSNSIVSDAGTCVAPSGSIVSGVVDIDSVGNGWACVDSATGSGTPFIWSTRTDPPPAPVLCLIGNWSTVGDPLGDAGKCGSACGTRYGCGPSQKCYYRTLSGQCIGNDDHFCFSIDPNTGADVGCGSSVGSTCKSGGGADGYSGQNWWGQIAAPSGTAFSASCTASQGTDSNPYPQRTWAWASGGMPIVVKIFNYQNRDATVTLTFKSLQSGVGWSETPITVTGTNVAGGKDTTITVSSTKFCKLHNYTVYADIRFNGPSGSPQWWKTNVARVDVTGSPSSGGNGNGCAGTCACTAWTLQNCFADGASQCTDAQNRQGCHSCVVGDKPGDIAPYSPAAKAGETALWQRTCLNAYNEPCNPGDGYSNFKCEVPGTSCTCPIMQNSTDYRCGSNGCPSTSISRVTQCYDLLGNPHGEATITCVSETACTEVGACNSWSSPGICAGNGCAVTEYFQQRSCASAIPPVTNIPSYPIARCVASGGACVAPPTPVNPNWVISSTMYDGPGNVTSQVEIDSNSCSGTNTTTGCTNPYWVATLTNSVNISYQVTYNISVCNVANATYCPYSYFGSGTLGASGTLNFTEYLWWSTTDESGVPYGGGAVSLNAPWVAGSYVATWTTKAYNGSAYVTKVATTPFTIGAANYSIVLNSISNTQLGSRISVPVTLYGPNVNYDLVVNMYGAPSVNESPISDPTQIPEASFSCPSGSAGCSINSTVVNYTGTPGGATYTLSVPSDGFRLVKYSVFVKGVFFYSGSEKKGQSNFRNFTIVAPEVPTVSLVLNKNAYITSDDFSAKITPVCSVSMGSPCYADLELSFSETNVPGSNFNVQQYRTIGSNYEKTYEFLGGLCQPSSLNCQYRTLTHNWEQNGFINTASGSYTATVIATFPGGVTAMATQDFTLGLGADISFDQSGFAPIKMSTYDNKWMYIFYGNYKFSNETGTTPYICARGEDGSDMGCIKGYDQLGGCKAGEFGCNGIDVISGLTAVAMEGDVPNGIPKTIVFTGYEFSGTGQVDKVGIIKYVDSGVFGNHHLGETPESTPRVAEISNSYAVGEVGCISNPVAIDCYNELTTAIQIGLNPNASLNTSTFTGGTFAYIYYVGQDAWLQCAGADGAKRTEPQEVSAWQTYGSDTPLYLGDCKIKGGITSADVDGDGWHEILGAGGLLDLRDKVASYGFGTDGTLIPVDVNSDGYLDLVYQDSGKIEVWPGNPSQIEYISNTLSGNLTCSVSGNQLTAVMMITKGPQGYATGAVYKIDYGDGYDETKTASATAGSNNVFTHPYYVNGVYSVTGTISYGNQVVNVSCSATSTGAVFIPPNLSTSISPTCGFGTDGIFTSYYGDVTRRGWSTAGAIVTSQPGLGLYFNGLSGEVYRKFSSSTNKQVTKMRFTSQAAMEFDFAYRARIKNRDNYDDLVKIRVYGGSLYVAKPGGVLEAKKSIVDMQSYDVILTSDISTGVPQVTVQAGLSSDSTLETLYSGPGLFSDAYDPTTGEVDFTYMVGVGNVEYIDCSCAGENFTRKIYTETEVDKGLESYGITSEELALLRGCVAAEPPYWYADVNGTPMTTTVDNVTVNVVNGFGEVIYVHGKSADSYPNVGAFCGASKRMYCDYDLLKFAIMKYPRCYKEAHNYCVDVTYGASVSQAEDETTNDGAMACTTILGFTSAYGRTAVPLFGAFGTMLANSWFEMTVVIIVVLLIVAVMGRSGKRRG